jgi:hypothetical protein
MAPICCYKLYLVLGERASACMAMVFEPNVLDSLFSVGLKLCELAAKVG